MFNAVILLRVCARVSVVSPKELIYGQDLESQTAEQRIALLNSHLRRNPKLPA